MYHMFLINQQAASHKSDMPHGYPSHMANSSWLSNQGETLAHFQKPLEKAEPIIHCNSFKAISKSIIQNKRTQNRYALKNKKNFFY